MASVSYHVIQYNTQLYNYHDNRRSSTITSYNTYKEIIMFNSNTFNTGRDSSTPNWVKNWNHIGMEKGSVISSFSKEWKIKKLPGIKVNGHPVRAVARGRDILGCFTIVELDNRLHIAVRNCSVTQVLNDYNTGIIAFCESHALEGGIILELVELSIQHNL